MIAPQFWLDPKVAKDQDKKNLHPAGPAPGPVFCRAFALFWVCHPELVSGSHLLGYRHDYILCMWDAEINLA
jgi:hypothetical protein